MEEGEERTRNTKLAKKTVREVDPCCIVGGAGCMLHRKDFALTEDFTDKCS